MRFVALGTMKILALLLIGATSGLIGALCGVGGGLIMVPAFTTFFKMDQKCAVATSLAAIVISSLAGTWKNTSTDLIQWKFVLVCGIASAVASYFGSDLMKSMSNPALTKFFGAVLIFIGIKSLFFS